jgi:hypothetical protein
MPTRPQRETERDGDLELELLFLLPPLPALFLPLLGCLRGILGNHVGEVLLGAGNMNATGRTAALLVPLPQLVFGHTFQLGSVNRHLHTRLALRSAAQATGNPVSACKE